MNNQYNWLGKTGFILSLVPVITVITLVLLKPDRGSSIGNLGSTIFFIALPLAVIISIVALKVSKNKGWAIAGLVIGGIQTSIIIFSIICVILYGK